MDNFTKEQVATMMVFAWNEGFDWSKNQTRDKPLHPGSLRYLEEKSGATLNNLDLAGQKKAKQLMEVI